MSGLPDGQRPRGPVAGREPDELIPAYGLWRTAFFDEDSRWEQQFRRERVKQCLPVSARRMNAEVVRVFITDYEMAEFVSCGSTTPTWIMRCIA